MLCPSATVGEICVRGPQVMKGYWNCPRRQPKCCRTAGCAPATSAAWTSGATSRITDRKKDMILVSGFNVYPNEIEEVVAMHPGVLEFAAIGVPDEKSGEAVKIFVVRKDPKLRPSSPARHCRGKPDRIQGAEERRIPQRRCPSPNRKDPPPPIARRSALTAETGARQPAASAPKCRVPRVTAARDRKVPGARRTGAPGSAFSRVRMVSSNSVAPSMRSNAWKPRSRKSCKAPSPAAYAGPFISPMATLSRGLRVTRSSVVPISMSRLICASRPGRSAQARYALA